MRIRTVVLYHASVTNAPAELDIGTALYRVENVFLSQLDGDQALNEVERHLRAGQWEPSDRIRLGLALNMRLESQEKTFERVRELIPQVPDETERDLVVSAILVLGDQGLTEEQRAQLRKELRNVSKLAEELYEEGRQEERIEIAERLLRKGMPIEDVIETTGLSEKEAKAILQKLH